MPRKRQDELERAIEQALMPGAFIGYRDAAEFTDSLEAVRARIEPLISRDGSPVRAIALLEIFIAGCYEKAEEIDDSSGGFGQVVAELYCDWIRARQAAKAAPEDTVRSLRSWMEHDDYGYCQQLETAAVAVLDRGGLRALERTALEMASGSGKESYVHTRSIEILKAIHVKRGDVGAYAALCELEDDLAPADCERLAEMCRKRRSMEDALTWVDRGLELQEKSTWPDRPAWRLPELRREILKRLGRGAEALASAWEDYCRAPSVYSYEELMRFVPAGERREWHGKALAGIDGADLSSRIDLLVKTKEWELLAAHVGSASRRELIGLSHYTTEPAAKALARAHPLPAAKLDVAMALRILEARKSKYYDAALEHLEQARKFMLRNGCTAQWQELAEEIRTSHRRKSGFISGFENLAEGRSTRNASFADRARERWKKGAGGGRS